MEDTMSARLKRTVHIPWGDRSPLGRIRLLSSLYLLLEEEFGFKPYVYETFNLHADCIYMSTLSRVWAFRSGGYVETLSRKAAIRGDFLEFMGEFLERASRAFEKTRVSLMGRTTLALIEDSEVEVEKPSGELARIKATFPPFRRGITKLIVYSNRREALSRILELFSSCSPGNKSCRARFLKELGDREIRYMAKGGVNYTLREYFLIIGRIRPLRNSLEWRSALGRNVIAFKLWERDITDLFTGNYSGTCIALHARKVMHEYLRDPGTDFLRIYLNGRRIGHVKIFHCVDEDGRPCLHVDYIGVAGGKYKHLHERIKREAVASAIKFAISRGYDKVYVAKEAAPAMGHKVVENRLHKLGMRVYSQYLSSEKYMVLLRQRNPFKSIQGDSIAEALREPRTNS